jgi:uncharacterized membrane-anchored protein
MNASQAIALGILVGQAVCAFLLTQPDVTLPPLVKVVIGAMNVALGVGALYLKVSLPGRETTS